MCKGLKRTCSKWYKTRRYNLTYTTKLDTPEPAKKALKSQLYNELSTELATKDFVRAEIGEVRAELKQNALLLKILIGITVFGLTLFNPAFVKLIELLMK